MLKQTIKYEDFNGTDCTDALYFNLTKTEMMDMMDIRPRLEAWNEITESDAEELTIDDIRELLEIVKILVEKAYGIRSEDGKHFRKSPEIFTDFKHSAAYDAFLFGLFEDPEKAVNFMTGIMPKGMVEQALDERTGAAAGVKNVALPEGDTLISVEKEVPAWVREDRDPTSEEFRSMSDAEKMAAFQRKSQRS